VEVGRWPIRWHRRNAIEAACPWPSLDRAECEIPLAAPIMRTVAPLSSGFGEGHRVKTPARYLPLKMLSIFGGAARI